MRKQIILSLIFSLCIFMTSQAFPEQIKLSLDLEIKEPENVIFHRIKDIATDSKNNIYILDDEEKMIYLFSEKGRFLKKIGRPGQGPGEFERPCSIYIDSKDIIYILDESNRRVEIFDSEANYIKSIKFLDFPAGSASNIIVDKGGNFYISGHYRIQNAVVGKFSSIGELIKHLPLPVIEYKGIKFDEHDKIMVMDHLCGGSMCFDEEERLFFSYKWPYLMKILTKEGNELFQFSRKNSLNWTPFILRHKDDSGLLFVPYTQSLKIFFLNNNYLINSIFAMDWEGNPRIKIHRSDIIKYLKKYIKKGPFPVLDIYTKEGEFIASTEINGNIYFLSSDKKGRILAVNEDDKDMPTIVRYRIEIIRNE